MGDVCLCLLNNKLMSSTAKFNKHYQHFYEMVRNVELLNGWLNITIAVSEWGYTITFRMIYVHIFSHF